MCKFAVTGELDGTVWQLSSLLGAEGTKFFSGDAAPDA
jgi:hypothetical protein